MLMSLVEKYGYGDIAAALQRARRLARPRAGAPDRRSSPSSTISRPARSRRKEDWVDLYAKPFYFGCEADDRMNAWRVRQDQPVRRQAQRDLQLGYRAFRRDRHARSAAAKPMSWSRTASSPTTISATSPSPTRVRLWGTQNPHFFDGTVVAEAARAELKKAPTPTRAAAE